MHTIKMETLFVIKRVVSKIIIKNVNFKYLQYFITGCLI